jgi:cardiolipin synthase
VRISRAVALAALLGLTGCASVPAHITLPALDLGEPAFFPTLEAYAQAPIIGGNRVDVLLNGEEIFPAMLAAIPGARRTITYAQYAFEPGKTGLALVEALAERCRAGVRGHVLLDAIGALQFPAEYGELLKVSGCELVFFRPVRPYSLWRANNRNHRRVLVVDGELGFTGGSGVSAAWAGDGRIEGHWRDTDVRIHGPAVEYLQGAFAESWLEATGEVLGGADYFPRPIAPRGTVHAQVIRSGPAGGSFAMYTTFLLALSSARRSILITNPYVLLDQKMIEILAGASRQGVRVAFLVPGVIDHPLVRHAGRSRFGELLRAGVEIYEYQPALLHAKTMVIDGVWSTVGSTNLDNRSFALNDELNAVFYDATVAERLERMFSDDLRYARRLDYDSWRHRGLGDRFFELLALPFRRFL